MQVDSTLMNVEDGGTVSKVTIARNKVTTAMVGNPPQILPPEFRGDVTLSQHNKTTAARSTKAPKDTLDTCNFNHTAGLSPLQSPNNVPVGCSALIVTDNRLDVPKVKVDNTGVFAAPPWSGSLKVDREESLNLCRSNMSSSHNSKTQMQSVQSTPPGFHCSTIFKPTQSVAFIPSPNYSSLCKITLPPALGQIAALREATASQFQKKIKPQSSGVTGTSSTRTYPYPFTVGRGSTSEKKMDTCTSKNKSSHLSTKNSKSVEHRSLASVVASPALALPVQHPSLTSIAPTHYTLSPTAAICCGSALANLASQGRLLNHIDNNNVDMPIATTLNSSVPVSTDHQNTLSANEPRDLPLDLSAKSKRPKCEPQEPSAECFKDDSSKEGFVNSKRTYPSMFSSSMQYPLLSNTQRNGNNHKQLGNAHILDTKPLWPKGSSQDPINNIPGTYVGVASPILASTLRGKDGKGTFADEFQSFAKQEFISIIDQGEHLASGEPKPSLLKSNQHALKLVKQTSTKILTKCQSQGTLTSDQSNAGGQKLDCSQEHLTLQGGIASTPPNIKNTTGMDGSRNTDFNQFKSHKKWERIKSPLSNLASIVKQQSLDTAKFVGEGSAVSQPALSKKTNKQILESPPVWTLEKRFPCDSQKDSTNLAKVIKKNEKVNATQPMEDTRDPQSFQAENNPQVQHSCLKPTIKCNVFENKPSSNGTKTDSKLAQVLEGEVLKLDSGSTDSVAPEKLMTMFASDSIDHCATADNNVEKKSNEIKEKPSTALKALHVKQKTQCSKKLEKEKSPDVSSEMTTGNIKQQINSESSTIKASPSKKKKQNGPILQQSLLADELSQHKVDVLLDKASLKKDEQSGTKGGRNYCSQKSKSPIKLSKGSKAGEGSSPRLRRGRRRTDESRLDLWGFATPSPPPSPVHPPPPSPPEPQAVRRPRGRPRSTPQPQRGLQRKDIDCSVDRKRQRSKNKKYQTGDYIISKVKLDDGEHLDESDVPNHDQKADSHKYRGLNPHVSSPEPLSQRASLVRVTSADYKDSERSPEDKDKPPGKRKFKSKHLCPNDEPKIKSKRLGKRCGSRAPDDDCSEAKKMVRPLASPKSFTSPYGQSGKYSSSESPPKRPIPPEVRRLIVNKNAGETLLQRAARLGYQEVVQYCLEKDVREVNRRDNAGYTALHEASSRGWVQIVQMLLKNGADVNCSAQDGTRPIHDAVASDNLEIVWLLLNHGADPTLATYSGQTPVKLAQSLSMKTFLSEYFTDLEGRSEHDPGLHWDFYSSSLFEMEQEPCWDFLLSEQNQNVEQDLVVKSEKDPDKDCLVFEFSSQPLLPCFHVQVSLTQGFCNWFLLADILKRLKISARIFKARYPHLEVVSLPYAELVKQVSMSQVSSGLESVQKGKNKDTEEEEDEEEDNDNESEEGRVELVRCVPELQRLLGSSIHILQDNPEEEDPKEDKPTNTGRLRSR